MRQNPGQRGVCKASANRRHASAPTADCSPSEKKTMLTNARECRRRGAGVWGQVHVSPACACKASVPLLSPEAQTRETGKAHNAKHWLYLPSSARLLSNAMEAVKACRGVHHRVLLLVTSEARNKSKANVRVVSDDDDRLAGKATRISILRRYVKVDQR
ncbi:hypothetical protein LX36DRAFT_444356 [Colletotrichum falcatum]|nr:hypothetical protein LX36DRAFT_444356 [Colletotrichum falcatum]